MERTGGSYWYRESGKAILGCVVFEIYRDRIVPESRKPHSQEWLCHGMGIVRGLAGRQKSGDRSDSERVRFGHVCQLQPQVSGIRGVAEGLLEVENPRADHAFEFTVEVLHPLG